VEDGGRDDLSGDGVVADFVDPLTNGKLFSPNGLYLLEGRLEVVKDVAADVVDVQKK